MMEKFSEMKYVRPDGEAYIRTIQKETKNFNEAADFDGAQAFELFLANGVRFRRVFRRYETGMVEEAGHDLF